MRSPRAPSMMLPLLVLLQARLQVSGATGVVELQVSLAQNEEGILADGRCCRGGREPPCPVAETCRTFFRVCLKEYQLRAEPGGPCVLGAASTPVLGGNVFSPPLQKPSDQAWTMVIPFDFAWPRSYSLVLEAWDAVNASDVTSPGSGQLIERVTRSGMVNPGEDWQHLGHHGRSARLEGRLRVRCHQHYYGPSCNLLCRPRNDFFGHHSCDAAGNKVCLDGWTGNKCQRAVCLQGCHTTHGFCMEPGECSCHYGWTGPHCDRCLLFPGCVHGSCKLPWKCDCETNWGGLLCNKDLNYCGSHRPCRNGGTCANKEPDEYECLCPEGFGGRNCEDAALPLPASKPPCPSDLCANGGSCHLTPSGPRCACPPGWRGKECQDGETNVAFLSAILLPFLLLAGGIPVVVVLLLFCRQRRFPPRVPGRTEPLANNSLRPDAVHLIRNLTHGEAERGSAVAVGMDKIVVLPAGLPPSPGLPKVDISNQERAKLNQLNVSPPL
ncbi:protein jagged-2-like [Erythrolamprus reginae]|uniref:protein jagged-2-like n=1 Tax=Erythrolamprus reginae TaxID=121349 RepID=UPI00396CD042